MKIIFNSEIQGGENMKRKIQFFILLLALFFYNPAGANIVNGGFETGDLNGWMCLGYAQCNVVTSYTSPYLTLAPQEGNYFATVEGGGALNNPRLEQTLTLNAGDVISGYFALDGYAMHSGSVTVDDGVTLVTIASQAHTNIPWTYWIWTAPATNTYALVFDPFAMGGPLPGDPTYVVIFADGITVTPSSVPEPATMLLLGLGLIGLAGVRRFER
jgi:hypothetical protein